MSKRLPFVAARAAGLDFPKFLLSEVLGGVGTFFQKGPDLPEAKVTFWSLLYFFNSTYFFSICQQPLFSDFRYFSMFRGPFFLYQNDEYWTDWARKRQKSGDIEIYIFLYYYIQYIFLKRSKHECQGSRFNR